MPKREGEGSQLQEYSHRSIFKQMYLFDFNILCGTIHDIV